MPPLCSPGHALRHGPVSRTCPACGWCTANANDVREKYCGNCKGFADHDTNTLGANR